MPFIAVTSFLCLRFFSPAIMAPKLFHLRERHADARTSRTLLLLAKAVQNVGNMDAPASRAKEAWMEPLQPTVRQGVAQLKDFITKLVDIEEKEGEQSATAPGTRLLRPRVVGPPTPDPLMAPPTAFRSCLLCPMSRVPTCLCASLIASTAS